MASPVTTTPTLRGYAKLIAERGVVHQELAVIEDLMREQTGGCLDHLDRRGFTIEVRKAEATLAAIRAEIAAGRDVALWTSMLADFGVLVLAPTPGA